MSAGLPPIDLVRQALEIYLQLAYPQRHFPIHVQHVIDALQTSSDDDFFWKHFWEMDGRQPPTVMSLRLGNQLYPHMKLVLVRLPSGHNFAFRVDPHDRHITAPPSAADCESFGKILAHDAELAKQIEEAWQRAGLIIKSCSDELRFVQEAHSIASNQS